MNGDWRALAEALPPLIVTAAKTGRCDYVNAAWTAFTGNDAARSAGDRWLAAVHVDDRACAQRQIRSANAAQPGHRQTELRLRSRDGTYRWFLAASADFVAPADLARRRVITTLTDIDDHKRAAAALRESTAHFRAVTDAMPQLVWIVDHEYRVQYANVRWREYTGIPLQADSPTTTNTIVHPDDLPILTAARKSLTSPPHEYECEVRLRRHDGDYRWHLLRAVARFEPGSSQLSSIIAAAMDVEAHKSVESALAESAATLAYRADHDELTNLLNRAKLAQRLSEMIAQARSDGTLVVVMYLDIDHFKAVNDTLGHALGDALLQEIGSRIRESLRAEDAASRFGGDEFVVTCRADDIVDAARIAERLGAAVRLPIELDGKRVVAGSSIGISLFPQDGDLSSELIHKADAAMYAVKQSGRNGWGFYSAPTHAPTVTALDLEVELREAIAREQFVVYYQPIIDLQSGRVIGAEALVRWAHPERGLLAPGEFIPFAEDHGLIAPIGELVLAATCNELRCMNLRPTDDFTIAVNVSGRQFARPSFLGSIAAAINAHGIEARRLEIEITESVVMGDTEAAIATLVKLDALGVRLSLDDFGTGYSSLAYLKNFPIHTLKIDRSFVNDIARNFTDQAIAKTIVTLAHSLGMRTIAEGVETVEQLDRLRTFGADCFQGYLVSRPLPADQFAAFIGERRTLRAR